MRNIFALIIILPFVNLQSQEISLSGYTTYYPNVKENRIRKDIFNLNMFVLKTSISNYVTIPVKFGIELKYGIRNLDTYISEPIEDFPPGSSAFLESRRQLQIYFLSIPLSFIFYKDSYINSCVGVKFGYLYLTLTDKLYRHDIFDEKSVGDIWSAKNSKFLGVPFFETNFELFKSFYFLFGLEYNFDKVKLIIDSNKNDKSKILFLINSVVKDLGNKIEYDFSGISLNFGLTYKI